MYPGSPMQAMIYGTAHAVAPEALDGLVPADDPSLTQRKGRLVPLCGPDVDEAALALLFESYYHSPSYDVLPGLCEALSAVYAGHPEARQMLPLVIVQNGLALYLAGTTGAAVYIKHLDETRPLFVPERDGRRLRAYDDAGADETSAPIYTLEWRLSPGDVVLASAVTPETLPSDRVIRRAAQARDAESAAKSLSRATRASRSDRPPALALGMPSFGPVPAFVPRRVDNTLGRGTPPPPPKPRYVRTRLDRRRGERSPIWTALIIAVVAVGLTLWIQRPSLSRDDIEGLVMWALTPAVSEGTALPEEETPPASPTTDPRLAALAATPTPETVLPTATAGAGAVAPAPTAQPTVTAKPTATAVPAPRLLSPVEGENVHDEALTLRWEWKGELGPSDYYDVRLWRLGAPQSSIAWTRDPFYVHGLPDRGWHNWTVAVIRGRDGVIEEQLSPEATPVEFRWDPDDDEGSTQAAPTPAPTRQDPGERPTRVAPNVTPQTGTATP